MSQMSANNDFEGSNAANVGAFILTDNEKDALGEIGNICMGTSATTLSQLLGKRVTITAPKVSLVKGEEYLNDYEKPVVATEVSYTKGLNGINLFLIKKDDALAITEVLMGSPAGADEMYLSAISEVMNQMVGSSSTALADLLHISVNISPPVVKELTRDGDVESPDGDMLIRTSFLLEIEDLLTSNILQIMPYDFGKKLAGTLVGEEPEPNPQPQAAAPQPQAAAPVHTQAAMPQPQAAAPQPQAAAPIHTQAAAPMQAMEAAPPYIQNKDVQRMDNGKNDEKIELKEVKFQSFNEKPGDFVFPSDMSNIDLIIDVPLHVTVVLGKTKKSIKEILEINRGSVIVLDRLAGEMVDVLVNGKLFARGEVVVIDDNYGVRITEITSDQQKEQ